jgi:autotransporter-associated beta strand protein
MAGKKMPTSRNNHAIVTAAALAAACASVPALVHADSTIYEYQFTSATFNPTTVTTNLVGSPFSYVNANPSQPPFSEPPFIVNGGIDPGDPPFYVAQGDWYPAEDGFNEDYYSFQVSVAPGSVLNASSFSYYVNSRQAVLFDSQIEYATNSSFTSPTAFDTAPFQIPASNVWNTFTASDAPISNGTGTYYFRIYNQVDPNGTGTISDLLNMGNILLTGSVVTDPNPTNMYWDPSNTGAPGSGGAGTWTGTTAWADGAIDYPWSNTIAEIPNFGGPTSGTVALGGPVSALNGINFTTGGYTVTGSGSEVLTVGGQIDTTASATIAAQLTTAAAGTLTKTGAATLTIAGTASLFPGTSLAISAGTLEVTTGGVLTANGASQSVGSATLTVDGSGSFATNSILNIGTAGASGTLNVQDTASVTTTSLVVGQGSGGTGIVNQASGTLTAPAVTLASGDSTTTGTFNLTGGTLSTGSVTGGAGTSDFFFNGGTLQASAASTNFLSNITNLQIQNGGAVIDTNGNNVTISQAIAEGAGSTGGFTKIGSGTLVLSASNTYTGETSVSAGTLKLSNQVLASSLINVASNAVLEYNDSANTYQTPATYTGTGILRQTGTGNLIFGAYGAVNVDFSPGALVDVEGGLLTGSSSYGGNWTGNEASLNIAGGASFNAVEAGLTATMQIDALTGAGTFLGGYFGSNGGLSTVTLGVAGGSGTFSGSLENNSGARLAIVKTGAGTQTLSGDNTNTGTTAVNQGTLLIANKTALPDAPLNITNTGTLQLSQSIGGTMIPSLSISNFGQLDINNNHILIQYGSGTDPIATIRTYIQSGYASGLWTGPGIVSSAARANSLSYGIGYADSADPGNPASLVSGTIDIQYTLLGDANLDGIVNGIDFGILAANFNKGVTGWDKGDFNYDNVVNGIDCAELAANFNKGASGISVGPGPLSDPALVAFAQANGLMADLTSIPDPACGTLMVMMAAGALTRRRTRGKKA